MSPTVPLIQTLQAHITVIPKPGKDPGLVTNNRLIALLNVDIKLYANILANRLLHLLPSLVLLDQVDFIPGREARDNTIKTLHIHHWFMSQTQPGFFLSVESEKAFDWVAWDYLHASLEALGLPPMMLDFWGLFTLTPQLRSLSMACFFKPFLLLMACDKVVPSLP